MSSATGVDAATLIKQSDGEWVSAKVPGITRKLLFRDAATGEATALLKFEPGSRFPAHTHPGGEEVFVISGEIQIGKHHLSAGDYLYTPPDGVHAASSKEGGVFLIRVPRPIEVLES